MGITVSCYGGRFAAADLGHSLVIYSLGGLVGVETIDVGRACHALTAHPLEPNCVVVGVGGGAKSYNTTTGLRNGLFSVFSETSLCTSVDFTLDGSRLLVAAESCGVAVFLFSTSQLLALINVEHDPSQEFLCLAAFDKRGERILGACQSDALRVYDMTGSLVSQTQPREASIWCVAARNSNLPEISTLKLLCIRRLIRADQKLDESILFRLSGDLRDFLWGLAPWLCGDRDKARISALQHEIGVLRKQLWKSAYS
eukprot:TRINITY_DN8091_c0_g1_i1.p1 TRINITY_DN8091_c0_g1~~TRINITY_DN8091_c0_g1_i1.p1  ORF type:complete len:256 (+),score=36.28 TRINITY_DN8091_c0_g1_i1:447-1214(+)